MKQIELFTANDPGQRVDLQTRVNDWISSHTDGEVTDVQMSHPVKGDGQGYFVIMVVYEDGKSP